MAGSEAWVFRVLDQENTKWPHTSTPVRLVFRTMALAGTLSSSVAVPAGTTAVVLAARAPCLPLPLLEDDKDPFDAMPASGSKASACTLSVMRRFSADVLWARNTRHLEVPAAGPVSMT